MWLGHHFHGQKVKGQGHRAALLTAVLARHAGGCSRGGRENVLAVGNCCYVAVCSEAQSASAPTEERDGAYRGGRPPTAFVLLRINFTVNLTRYVINSTLLLICVRLAI